MTDQTEPKDPNAQLKRQIFSLLNQGAVPIQPQKDQPRIQLHPEEPIGIKIAIDETNKNVLLNFSRPITLVGFNAEQAMALGRTIIEAANKIKQLSGSNKRRRRNAAKSVNQTPKPTK